MDEKNEKQQEKHDHWAISDEERKWLNEPMPPWGDFPAWDDMPLADNATITTTTTTIHYKNSESAEDVPPSVNNKGNTGDQDPK